MGISCQSSSSCNFNLKPHPCPFCDFCLLLAFWLYCVLEGLLKLLNVEARGIGWFTDVWICQFQILNLFQIWSQSLTLVYVVVGGGGKSSLSCIQIQPFHFHVISSFYRPPELKSLFSYSDTPFFWEPLWLHWTTQDNLPISRSLIQSHWQSPFCHVR